MAMSAAAGSAIGAIGGAAISTGGTALGSLVNLDFNKQQFEYQKELQRQIFEREDNAMRRKVADYSAAGYSPLAALEGSTGGLVGTVANTAHYSDVGALIGAGANNIGSQFNSGMANFNTAIRDADNSRIALEKISSDQYIAEMQNDTRLRELYQQNQQFYDGLAQEQKQFELELSQAKTLAEAKIAADKYIAQCDRTMTYHIAKMQDSRQREALKQDWNKMVAQMRYEAKQAEKQREWTSKENAWNRVANFATGAMNAYTSYATAGVVRRSVNSSSSRSESWIHTD